MKARQDSDNLAWDRSDERWEEAIRQVRLSSTCRKVEAFAEKALSKSANFVPPLIVGGFNVLYPLRMETFSSTVFVRQPCPNQAVFPEEKTSAEAATAVFLSEHTSVPIPELFGSGIDPGIGPFIIMRDMGTRREMVDVLQAPRQDPNDTPVLRPDIEENVLMGLYRRMARVVAELARPVFPRIGALTETSPGCYEVGERPFTLNMNNMFQLSNVPKSVFPPKGTTYQTADDWYTVLAEMQVATLIFQHNDMVSSEDDCRNKYVARQLFRRLAKKGRLSSFGFAEDDWSAGSKDTGATLPMPDGPGSFRLWVDDFRPANVLIDEKDDIIGVIDWEYAYAGPAQFALDPPWWLLLDVPEMWEPGIEDWTSVYERRLQTWISAMEEVERDATCDSLLLSA